MSDIKTMLEEIRQAMARCTAPEKAVFEALTAEAEGWNMRLEELEDEEDS